MASLHTVRVPFSARVSRHPRCTLPVTAPRCRVVARAADLEVDSYMVLGLSHCFEKGDDGKLVDRMLIEPVSASSLECLANGARTSFKLAAGVTFGQALSRSKGQLPDELQSGRFCDNWGPRCEAAARTWTRPHAQDNLMDLVPLGRVRGSFNFNLEDKRVLNLDVEVKDEDNVKQDISIDVYGRKEKQDKEAAKQAAAAAAAAEAAQAKLEEEDDLDKLLLA